MTGNISSTSKFEPFVVVFWPKCPVGRKEQLCPDRLARCRRLSPCGAPPVVDVPPRVLSEVEGPLQLPRLRSGICRFAPRQRQTALTPVLVRYSSIPVLQAHPLQNTIIGRAKIVKLYSLSKSDKSNPKACNS